MCAKNDHDRATLILQEKKQLWTLRVGCWWVMGLAEDIVPEKRKKIRQTTTQALEPLHFLYQQQKYLQIHGGQFQSQTNAHLCNSVICGEDFINAFLSFFKLLFWPIFWHNYGSPEPVVEKQWAQTRVWRHKDFTPTKAPVPLTVLFTTAM